jgi:hypothetical protein
MTTGSPMRRIQPDPETALALERERLASLAADAERELAAEEAIQAAAKTFRSAMNTYVATFPHGLDPCDPDSDLCDALDLSITLHAVSIQGLCERLKQTRVSARRLSGRRFA